MKLHLSKVFLAFALLRALKYLYNKILYLIGIINKNPIFTESVWQGSLQKPSSSLSERDLKPSLRWPIVFYLGLVFAAPYLISRLIGVVTRSNENPPYDDKWKLKIGPHYIATAIYDFDTTREGELPLREGVSLVLAPRHLQPRVRGWILGTDGKKTGLLPANYIHILGRRQGSDMVKPDVVSSTNRENFLDEFCRQSI